MWYLMVCLKEKGYSRYIDDTPWCNNWSIYSLGWFNQEWGPTYLDGSDDRLNTYLIFSNYDSLYIEVSQNLTPTLTCDRNTDEFTGINL